MGNPRNSKVFVINKNPDFVNLLTNIDLVLRSRIRSFGAMNGEHCLLVKDKPIEFQKYPIEAQDIRTITHRYSGI